MVALPNTLSNSDAPDAEAIQANFTTITSALSSLRNSNIADDAGIESRKLAQNFSPFIVVVPLLSVNQGADFSSNSDFGPFATSFADVVAPFRIPVPSGRNMRLVSVEWYIAAASSTPAIEVRLLVDSAVVGQAVPLSTADRYYSIVNSNPYSAELRDIADLAVFQPQIRQASAGSGTARGLTMTLAFKSELTA